MLWLGVSGLCGPQKRRWVRCTERVEGCPDVPATRRRIDAGGELGAPHGPED
jgi:hypothetical protein